MKKIINLLLILSLFLVSCSNHHSHKPTSENVKSTKYLHHNSDGTDVWIYYYMMTMNNQMYAYSSTSPISDYSSASWSRSSEFPTELEGIEVEWTTSNIDVTEFSPEMQVEINEVTSFDNPTSSDGTDSESGDNSGDSGDSGSGDSGGSDGGGGDGGGGGGD